VLFAVLLLLPLVIFAMLLLLRDAICMRFIVVVCMVVL